MDHDAYVDRRRGRWGRLEELERSPRRTGADVDEMLDLYRRSATDLSRIRTEDPDPDTVGYLSALLMRVRRRGLAPRRVTPAGVGRFFGATFPAALYRSARWWVPTMLVSLAVAVAMGAWFVAHPEFEAAVSDPETVRRLVEVDFERYYSEHAASSFAFRVWTNNAWVAALCIAFGVLGAPVLYLLWQNVLNLALTGSIMVRHGRGELFFGLILPHGLLELTAVFVAAGVGLRWFASWVSPGARPRTVAVAQEGRTSVGIAVGLVGVLLVSGIVEAFVTPSPLPTWGRIGIGVAVELAFLAYVFGLGRAAARRGVTGDAQDQEALAPASA